MYPQTTDIYYYCEGEECLYSILEEGWESDGVSVHSEPCPKCGSRVSDSYNFVERDDDDYNGRACDDYDYDLGARIA
jgi:transcription initiation factor IIE alpha subunit